MPAGDIACSACLSAVAFLEARDCFRGDIVRAEQNPLPQNGCRSFQEGWLSSPRFSRDGAPSTKKEPSMIPNSERPYSFVTLLKLYRRGLIDQQALNIHLLENLIDLAETQQAHTVLIEMMSEAIGGLDQDLDAQAHYLHLARPSQAKRDGDDWNPDQNGTTGSDPSADEAGSTDEDQT
jgi:hypothetical protein